MSYSGEYMCRHMTVAATESASVCVCVCFHEPKGLINNRWSCNTKMGGGKQRNKRERRTACRLSWNKATEFYVIKP